LISSSNAAGRENVIFRAGRNKKREMHCPTFARSLRVGRVLVSQLVWKFGATPPALFADFSGADVIPVSSAFYSRIALAWSKYV
jgi:hypothetical protein